MACLDIQDAYLHVSIHPSMRKFLCFHANGRHFKFTVLPFGLNIAPLVFSSILRPIITQLREEQINVLAYPDDLIVWDISFNTESLLGCLAFAAQLLPRTRYLKRSLTRLMRPLPRSGTSTEFSKDLLSLLRVWAFTDALEEVGPLRPPPVTNTIRTDASRHG